jgi:hypothetical protein
MSLRRFSFFLNRLGLYAGKNMVPSELVYLVCLVYLVPPRSGSFTGH